MNPTLQLHQSLLNEADMAMMPSSYTPSIGTSAVQQQARQVAQKLEADKKDLKKIASQGTVTGVIVALVVGGVLLYFIYYSVLGRNNVVFGILVACLAVALLFSLAKTVQEEGGSSLGAISV